MQNVSNPFGNFKYDIPASVVVFLVALPLCLGIALASGAPLLSGIIAGIVGGIVIGSLSGSNLSVSGPAAGLTAIVIQAIHDLGAYQTFLLAVVIAGILQFILGLLRAGSIGHFFPSSVIKGMLSAIGLILILKQIPHALGYDKDYEGDEAFFQPDGENTFSEILSAVNYLSPGAIVVCLVTIGILILWDNPVLKKHKIFQYIPGPLVAVLTGIILNIIFQSSGTIFAIQPEHMVTLPISKNFDDFLSLFSAPDFSQIGNPKIYITAITLALVASLESLLSIEACDKLDEFKRITPLNRELRAQGIGNFVSGLIGGLPITAVIVRSSANINSGARTKLSTILHGLMLLTAVVFIPTVLNMIPLAALAGILLMTGYKLTKPSLYREMFRKGWEQFIPFIVTIIAILITNLLVGIFIGIVVGVFFVLKSNFYEAISIVKHGDNYLLRLNYSVSFLNKSILRQTFERIPEGSNLIIDGGGSQFIDADIIETIQDFILNAPSRNIQVELKKSFSSASEFFRKSN
ncbi:SulP family inorganic anion transporter [Ohtaekwangia sp.]|uniref:SulP family inorganic anion transporter n=1 Tax=Ohtaekwangia sp. TaxID=2066019 RepID=UPI002FDE7E8A